MKLFENIYRDSLEPANYNQDTFGYYNSSARGDIGKIRDVLNQWFTHYPEEEQKELKSRFYKNFNSAFYELYIFTLFRMQGFNAVIHPKILGTDKKPDFFFSKGKISFYLEAKTVGDKSHQEEALERKTNEFYDNLSKVQIMNFYLGIDALIFKSKKQPSTKKLIPYVEQKISELDPEVVTNILNTKGYQYIPKFSYEDEDIEIVLKAIPVIPEARNQIFTRPLGMFPIETYWGGNEDAIRNAISEKAKRYGNLDKPYIIAINALGNKVTSTTDVDIAILGSVALSWITDPEIDGKWSRQKDGVFLNNRGARLKNLSGVFITKVYPHSIPSASYWLYEHPFSKIKFDFNNFDLLCNKLNNGQFNSLEGKNLGDILKIANDWLED